MVELKSEDIQIDEDSDSEVASESESKVTSNKRALNKDSKKPSKKPRNDLYKQPTAEEICQLRETEYLFNSNIFRMQINALLDEIKIKPKHISDFESWFQEFKNTISNLKKDKTTFAKPIKIQLIGSQGNHLTNIPNETVKFTGIVILTMPKTLFYAKDYLDHRYTGKKETYIQQLLQHLQSNAKCKEIIKHVSKQLYLGNPQINYIRITPTFSDFVRINVFLVPEQDTFKPTRFLPGKNNLKTFEDDAFPEFEISSFAENKRGTMLYNAVQLFDLTLEMNLMYLHELLEPYAHIKDAIKLLSIWLRQRHLNTYYTSFTDDLLLYLLGYLFKKKKINKLMSSYQVVRIVWLFLSSHEEEKLSLEDTPELSNIFLQEFVLLDKTCCYNSATFLDKNILAKVKTEAKYAVDALDNAKFDMFSHLFTIKFPVELLYDAILKVRDLNSFRKIYWNTSDEQKFEYFGHYQLLIRNYIETKLKYALTNRIFEILPIHSSPERNTIIFGINLNPENCYNVIEKGPKQFEPGADEFREFWGSLADLRRFKDSSIYEAVYFEDVKTIQGKRLLFTRIVEFVMKEKLELNYELNGGEMESLLTLDHVKNPFPSGSNEEATLQIKAAHTNLDKILRNLKLPLPITAVQCTSDIYWYTKRSQNLSNNCFTLFFHSYTNLFPPIATNHNWNRFHCKEQGDIALIKSTAEKNHFRVFPHLVEPINCVIHLAMNSKWPNELQAFRAMKTIYFFEIAKQISADHTLMSAVHKDFIDVYHQGYVFRLHLFQPKEIGLLKQDVTSDGITCYKDTEESLSLERDFDVLPKIIGALNGLHQEHTSFGPSTCLIKRWLRAQMLDAAHISDIVVNLLNASLFIDSFGGKSPVLPQLAFLRFLKFISDFDYNFRMVVVNFNGALSMEQLSALDAKFLQARQTFNTLHIVTPFDDGKSVFSKEGPSAILMNRIKRLAKATYDGLMHALRPENQFIYKPYFIPNLSGYDLLIHLYTSANVKKHEHVTREQKQKIVWDAFDKEKSKCFPVVDFNPVLHYLQDLRENYGDYALFFHDSYGGNVIGVLWKQNLRREEEFKVAAVHGRKLSADNKLHLDVEALIEDFYLHGKPIVHSIEVLQQKND